MQDVETEVNGLENKRKNEGINQFRLIAAFMVVAIHTFPFYSINDALDTLITLTLFRVAVPFFFMVTGYFVLAPFVKKPTYPYSRKIWQFIKKQLVIYVMAVLFYLPLSLYSGSFSLNESVWTLLKDFFFDGTFYHLWYFPAVILGLLIVMGLLRYLSLKWGLLVTLFLFILGVTGDSYYHFFNQVSFFQHLFDVYFQIFHYTRNGLLFAPLFICLGVYCRLKKRTITNQKLAVSLCFPLFLLVCESFFVHRYSLTRHDSMYFSLPLVMLFLFLLILNWQPRFKVENASMKSLLIYIFHPIMIVFSHFLAKGIPFIANSLINYLLVASLSYVFSTYLLFLFSKKEKKSPPRAGKYISVSALRHNVKEIRSIISSQTEIMAVIKADAYGCDALFCGQLLEKLGIRFFAVATCEEAIALRQRGIKGEILILSYTDPELVKQIKKYSLIQSIGSVEYAQQLNNKKIAVRCHLKIDTGMHRLGLDPNVEQIVALYQMDYLLVEGIYSHLGSSDSLDEVSVRRTKKQINEYDGLLKELGRQGISYGVTHLQGSYGILNYPELTYDFVRPGIMMYGMLSLSNEKTTIQTNLQPVINIQAKLISRKMVAANELVGYGNEYQLTKETWIGVVSIGYADGIPRDFGNKTLQLTYGESVAPQIGRICMDMLLIDLTNLPEIKLGEMLTVIPHFEGIAVDNKTITNELLSRIGTRLSLVIK